MVKPVKLKIKTPAFSFERERIAELCAAIFSGFVLSLARLFGSASPFAAAMAAAVSGSASPAVLAGAVLGFVLRLDGAWSARQLAVVTAAAAVNFITHKYTRFTKRGIIVPLNAGICMLLTGLTVLAAQGFNADGLMLYICESVVAAAAAAFLNEAWCSKGAMFKREPLSQKQLSAVLVSACIYLVSLEGIELAGLSPFRALAVFCVLCAAKWLGAPGGSICGGAMGFAMSIGSGMPFLGSAYTFGGMLAGLFSPMGRLAQACAFAICNAVVVLANTGQDNLWPPLFETALATVSFVLVPKKFFSALSVYFAGRQKLPEFETMKKALLMRLNGVRGGLEEVADAVEQIAQRLSDLDSGSEDAQYSEIKRLVRDQFSVLSMALGDVSQIVCEETRFDTAAAARISCVLESYGIEPREIICSETGGITRVEVCAEKIKGKLSRSALMSDMETACGYKLNSPTIREEKNETVMTFVKKPQLNLRIGKAQFTASEGGLCGDSCDCFLDKNGNQIIVISDGMGTGPRAAVDGAVAAWLFAKLLIAGLNFDSSLRLSNSALIVKSEEETLATIDAVKIDLHTGKAEFFKAGASNSFVCKGNKVYSYGKPSMPLGILREIEFNKEETTLGKGDVLLMMSDGVGTAAYSLIAEELRKFNKKDPSALAERVVEIAKSGSKGKHADDITAIAVIVG